MSNGNNVSVLLSALQQIAEERFLIDNAEDEKNQMRDVAKLALKMYRNLEEDRVRRN